MRMDALAWHLQTMEALAIACVYLWLLCLGATVGSFLNVVVWRLPRGLSLVHPGSCCPACGHPIRLHDNIPILSWLVLRGRCRDCGAPIALRYLLVELASGLLFSGLAIWRTLGPAAAAHALDPRWLLSWELAGRFWLDYLRDVTLLGTLLAAALIEADGFSVPWRLWWPAGLLAVAFHPGLMAGLAPPEGGGTASGLAGGPPLWHPLRDGVWGWGIGAVLEALRRKAARGRVPSRPWAAALGVVAATLGWQAMLPVAAGSVLLKLLTSWVERNRLMLPTAAAIGFFVLLRWAERERPPGLGLPGPAEQAGWLAAVYAALAVAGAAGLGWCEALRPADPTPTMPSPPEGPSVPCADNSCMERKS